MADVGNAYLSLKLAAKLFAKPLDALAPEELRRVRTVAARQQEIEALILATPEAASVVLPAPSLEASLGEIRGRYGSDEDYQADLDRTGLDTASLRRAVEREMVVEAVLESVAARSAAVSDIDVEIFWLIHKDRFRHGETRLLRHILITVNDRLAGSERAVARQRIDAIRARLLERPERFGEQALKHSECPTAMTGGLLGKVPRGQLYPELEAAAFALAESSLSEPVETELGYHLLYCEKVDPEKPVPFEQARATIRERLELQRRCLCQKAWIKALRRQHDATVA